MKKEELEKIRAQKMAEIQLAYSENRRLFINKQNNNEIHCNFCQKQTGNLVEKRIGCAAIACAFIHIPFFGPFFFMVCLDDKYKDTDTICVVCRQLKHRVEGDICKK